MIDSVAHCTDKIVKVEGPARSGKTEALVRRCCTLLSQETAPESIFVAVTSARAADAFRARLAAALGPKLGPAANGVRISTVLDACADVLDTEPGRAFTGRPARLLSDAEYLFFLEDMKTLGLPARRLRGMLGFFYAQWSALKPEADWIEPGDETKAMAHLKNLLSTYGAMLAQEAPALAAAFLMSEAGAQAQGSYACVLCDDFQNLSHAEQTCACLFAGEQIIVCGSDQATCGAHAHACPEGFTRFAELRRNVRTFELGASFGDEAVLRFSRAIAKTAQGLSIEPCAQGQGSAEESGVSCIKWQTPEDELTGFTKHIRRVHDEAGEGSECESLVLVPNAQWAHIVGGALQSRGFDVSLAGASRAIGGDPRDESRAQPLSAFFKLALLADPRDAAAWRCWCGIGNFLTNSDAWSHLLESAHERNIGILEALEGLEQQASEPFPRALALSERYAAGKAFIEANAGRKGFSLLKAIGAQDCPAYVELPAFMTGEETAAELYRTVREFFGNPRFMPSNRTLRIATYDAMGGIEAQRVFAFSCVDGLVPTRDAFEVISTDEAREKAMARQRRAFASAVSKACRCLTVSYFCKAPLELAEQTKMLVTRVRSENGGRVALVRPCSFLAEAEAHRPATTGGQALLASEGLA